MNIGQIARNQQMLYKIANKSVSSGYSANTSSSSKISDYSALLSGWGSSSTKNDTTNFFSTTEALQGTPRQIAKRLYDASFSSDAANSAASGVTQGTSAGGDQNLKAIQEQLRAHADALQQTYQPDQKFTGSFEELQSIAEKLVSRLQTVNLSDETTKKIQDLALTDAKNSAGAQESSESDAESTPSALSRQDRIDLIQGEVQKFSPSKRAAALNTINKVWQSELDRIGEHIKKKDPNWTSWGDKFDVGILDDYKAGINVWV